MLIVCSFATKSHEATPSRQTNEQILFLTGAKYLMTER
jgi:hypothetical protein